MLIAAETFSVALLACVGTNLDNILLVLAGADARDSRRHILVFVLLLAAVIGLALLFSRAVDLAVPAVIAWIGLVPLSMGIYELGPRQASAGATASGLPLAAFALTLSANSLDTLIVQTVLFADVAAGYDFAALAGSLAAAALLAATAFVLLSRPGPAARILALAPAIRPWMLILVGILILMDTGFDTQ